MYNEESKTRFLEECVDSPKTRKVVVGIFNSFAPHEEIWGKDLCTRSAEELQPVVDSIMAMRIRSNWTAIYLLKRYVQWCIVNNIPGACDGIFSVQIAGLEQIKKRMVSSPIHLQRCLDEVFDCEKDGTIDNIYRCYYWAVYAGMKEEDVMRLRRYNIDFIEQRILFGMKSYPLYRESVPAFRNAVELTEFVSRNSNYREPVIQPRVDGDNIMRGIRCSPGLSTIRASISKRIREAVEHNKTEVRLSYSRIRMSGLFYRMYENERAGEPISFAEAVEEMMAGKKYRINGVNKGITTEHIQNQREKEYMLDYQRWKLAFEAGI